MKKIKKPSKANFIYIVPIVLSVIMLTAFLTFNFSYAKYVTTGSISMGARVARMVIDLTETNGDNADRLTYRPEPYEYYFTVKNYKDGLLSEVEVEYYITIDDKQGEYIGSSYTLYRINDSGERELVEVRDGRTVSNASLGKITLSADNKPSIAYQAHNYVFVYNTVSVTASDETLFSINVSATQKN